MTTQLDVSIAQAEGWDRHWMAPGERARDADVR